MGRGDQTSGARWMFLAPLLELDDERLCGWLTSRVDRVVAGKQGADEKALDQGTVGADATESVGLGLDSCGASSFEGAVI